jgi:arylsulfatase A-like enzyme
MQGNGGQPGSGGPLTGVVLITVDSLRADAVEFTTEGRTPALAQLAARGTTFENAFAHGNWTPFSFPSLLGSRPIFAERGDIGLPETPTLAEVLSEAGVRTAGFNAANGFLTAHWGYDRGFDAFEAFLGDGKRSYSKYVAAHPTIGAWIQLITSPVRRVTAEFWRTAAQFGRESSSNGASECTPSLFGDTSRMLDVESRARSFLRSVDGPFFLWVHHMDAHTPYVPAPRHLREVADARLGYLRTLCAQARAGLGWTVGDRTLAALRTLYSGAVRQVDASIGRLQRTLEATGLAEETCVVVAGDHGEEFQEHGHLAHYPKLYDELIRVPLIVSHPAGRSQRISSPVGLEAIPPTVCGTLGIAPSPTWDGRSLLETVLRGHSLSDEPVISTTVRGEHVTQQPIPRRLTEGDLVTSARTHEWTYIENTATGERELYHRPSDPIEYDDLLKSGESVPRAVEPLEAAAANHVVDLKDGDASTAEAPPEVVTRLKALGYQ